MSQHATHPSQRTAFDPIVSAVVDAGTLSTALDAVAALVSECVVQVTEDGFTIDAQDPATVALTSVEFPASAFESYDAEPTKLGVDLDRLGAVLDIASPDELVRLTVNPETRTLHVRVGELAYTLGLIDPDAVRAPPEDFGVTWDVTADATIDGRALANVVRAADMVSNHVALGADPAEETLYARADGDTDAMELTFSADDCDDLTTGDAHSLYSVSYLDSIARVVPADASVHLELGEEAPLKLAIPLADGSVTYYLAPRRRIR